MYDSRSVGKNEVKLLRDERPRSEDAALTCFLDKCKAISDISVLQHDVLIYRARFSPKSILYLLQNHRYAVVFEKGRSAEYLFRTLIERRMPARAMLNIFNNALSMRLTMVGGFQLESVDIPADILAHIMGQL